MGGHLKLTAHKDTKDDRHLQHRQAPRGDVVISRTSSRSRCRPGAGPAFARGSLRPRCSAQFLVGDIACPATEEGDPSPHGSPAAGKDMVTPFTQCLAPIALMASAVPAYGHLPPSSCSWPTVTSTPGSTLAARTGAMQHKLKGEADRVREEEPLQLRGDVQRGWHQPAHRSSLGGGQAAHADRSQACTLGWHWWCCRAPGRPLSAGTVLSSLCLPLG